MKLHLPKQLFTALLAAITLATPATLTLGSTAWGSTGWASRYGLSGTGLYIGGTGTNGTNLDGILSVTESTPSGGVLTTFVEKVDVTAGKPSLTEFYIVADKGNNEGVNAEIRELIVNSGTTIGVDVSGWGSGRVFSDLEIEKLTIGTEAVPGTAVLNVSVNHCVTVGGTTGSLSSVNNAGTLTLGAVALSGNVTNSGTFTMAGTLSGTGTLTNTGNGKVKVDTTNFIAFDGLNYTKADGTSNSVKAGFLSTEQTLQVLGEDVNYDGEVYINDSTAGTTLTNGAVTMTIGAVAGTFYVNDDWTYDAAASAGATAFYVASAGTFTCETLPGIQISNNGNVSIDAGTNNINLNSIFNAETGITQTATGTTTITGSGAVSMNDAVTLAGKVVISGGSFTNNGKNLNGGTGGTLVLQNIANATLSGEQSVNVNVEVGSGTTLSLASADTFNWDSGNKLTVLTGGKVNVGSDRHSLSSSFEVIMAGGTIEGQGGTKDGLLYGLDFYKGGTIRATENSTINTAVGGTQSSGSITVNVDSDKTLTFEGQYAKFSGSKAISKTGAGNVLYKGASFTNALTISGGVFEYYMEDTRAHSGSISGAGTFKKSGAGTLTFDSANTSVTTLNVAGGKLVYNSSTETTHTLSSNAGTTFEKTGSSTLTADINNLKGELLISAGTLKLKEKATDTTSGSQVPWRSVTVGKDAVFDINGKPAYNNLTLESGSTLSNSNANTDPGASERQLPTITLTGAATMNATGHIRMLGSGHDVTALYLGGHTLTKTGTCTFFMQNTHVKTGGTIQINDGLVKAYTHNSKTQDLNGLNLHLNGGNFELAGSSQSIQNLTLTSGTLTIGSGLTLTTMGDVIMAGSKTEDTSTSTVTYTSTVSGNLCLSGTITLNGSVDMSSATLSGTSLGGFTRVESAEQPATSGLRSLTYQIWSGDGSVNSSQNTISVGGVNYTMNAATGTFTTAGTEYYVATGDTITAGGTAASADTASATSFVVDGTLNIAGDASGSLTSVGILTGTVGSGAMVLQTNATLGNGTSTHFKGDIQIDSDSKLALGSPAVGSTTSAATVDVSSLRSVKLNGGELYIRGVQATLNEVESVADSTGSTLTVYDMTDAAHAVSIGALTLNADLELYATWKSTINIDNVTGSGALTVSRSYTSGNSGDTTTLNINSLDGFTGSMTVGTSGKTTNLSISTGAVEGGVSFGGITTTAVNNFEFNVQTNTTVGTLNMAAGTVNLSAGTTLTLGQTGEGAQATTSSIGTVVASSAGNTIHLNEMATLNAFTKGTGSGTITLTGSGTYNLGELTPGRQNATIAGVVTMGNGTTADEKWTGTVTLSGGNNSNLNSSNNQNICVQDINFDNLGQAGSTVEIAGDGLYGYLVKDSQTYETNITLTSSLYIQNSYTSDTASTTFSGNISADATTGGSFIITRTNTGTNKYVFSGDVTNWKTSFTQNTTGTGVISDVTFTGDASTIYAAIKNENAGDLNLNVTTAGAATFHNTVNATNFATTKDVTFNDDTTFTGTMTATGKHVSLGQDVDFSLGAGTANAVKAHRADKLTASSSGVNISVGAYSTLTLSNYLDLSKGGDAAGQMTIGTNAKVSAAQHFWMNKNYSILLEDAAELIWGSGNIVTIAGRADGESRISSTAEKVNNDIEGRDKYDSDNNHFILQNVDVSVAAGEDGRTMGNLLTGSSVTNTGSGTLTVNNSDNTLTKVTADKGDVKLAASMQVDNIAAKFGKVVSVTNGNTISMGNGENGMSISTTGADATLTARSDDALVEMQSATSFSISDMVLSNVKLSAAEGASVALNNVSGTAELAGAGHFSISGGEAQYTLAMSPVQAQVAAAENEKGSTALTLRYSSNTAITMSGTGSKLLLSADPTVDANGVFGTYDVTLTLSNFGISDADLGESGDLTALSNAGITFTGWLGDALSNQTTATALAEAVEDAPAAPTAPTVSYTYTPVTEGSNVGTLVITINGLNVPEPATSTLSLLALAALAARRRRK